MIEKFFTTEQVANILQVHPFTILKFIKEGKLKGVKLGRVYRIMESDVKAFLDSRTTGSQKTAKNSKALEKHPEDPKTDTPTKDNNQSDEHYYII